MAKETMYLVSFEYPQRKVPFSFYFHHVWEGNETGADIEESLARVIQGLGFDYAKLSNTVIDKVPMLGAFMDSTRKENSTSKHRRV
jgi:hypothetical protein